MRRRALIVGNWKMNGLIESSCDLADAVLSGLDQRADRMLRCEVVICPPATALYALHQRLGGGVLKLGGQNLSEHESGPHTGEVCGIMLRNVGCWFVIVGHSERRATGEGNEQVGRKMAAAFRDGLIPIVCVGETLDERERGAAEAVVREQIAALLPCLPVARNKRESLVVAYEPVWAIGTGRNAEPEQILAMHGFIRSLLTEALGAAGEKVRILYGGSLKPANARTILALGDVDGGLIGGAALKAADFLAIIDAVPDEY
ncbi:MAG: triose-phosphate isomerase [Magnetococcales bacterium]|nr:triose-phosphate isomerase [Magnetococcales bacterium]